MANLRYTDAEVIAALKKEASRTPHNQLAKKLGISPQYLSDILNSRRKAEGYHLPYEAAKRLGYTLHHFYTKDRHEPHAFPPPPTVKKGQRYTHEQFVSIMANAIGELSYAHVSLALGYTRGYFSRVLARDIPPSALVTKSFGFTRVRTRPREYYFVKD